MGHLSNMENELGQGTNWQGSEFFKLKSLGFLKQVKFE